MEALKRNDDGRKIISRALYFCHAQLKKITSKSYFSHHAFFQQTGTQYIAIYKMRSKSHMFCFFFMKDNIYTKKNEDRSTKYA